MKTLIKTALVTLIAVTAAHAAEPRIAKTVHYGDLNLDSAAGATTLMSRLKSAARYVCEGDTSVGPHAHALYEACVERSIREAVESIDKQTLNALYVESQASPRG